MRRREVARQMLEFVLSTPGWLRLEWDAAHVHARYVFRLRVCGSLNDAYRYAFSLRSAHRSNS